MDGQVAAHNAGVPAETGNAARGPAFAPGMTTEVERAAQRAACLADPGAFHGAIAAELLHWFVPDIGPAGAWLTRADGTWTGWDAATLEPLAPALPAGWTPWSRAFVADDPPHWRWFEGAMTNSAFNEVDRHVLAGHGAECAIIFEGDRWDLAAEGGRGAPVDERRISRRELLVESVRCALALRALGLKPGDRIALNMPSIPEQIFWTEGAKRAGILYTPVFGGFSDKTLSDRIADAGARIVITADGGWRTAQVVPFKAAYTDPALDKYLPVTVALEVVRARLADPALGVDPAIAGRIADTITATLAGELTVERADVMRGAGRALAEASGSGGLSAAQASAIRIALAQALVDAPPRVEAVIVVRHAGIADIVWRPERDRWAHELLAAATEELLAAARGAGIAASSEAELMALGDADLVRALWAACPPLPVEAGFPLFFIYTSGSTGKPKGVVHTHGAWLAGVTHTMRAALGAQPGEVLYTVADPGWITGQAYLIGGPLSARVTTLVTEGSPVFPHAGRFAAQIERHGVAMFKAGVTFLKSVMQDPANLADIRAHDLSRLRLATFCAEPVSEAVHAFGQAHVTPHYINSYWATEHGGIAFSHPWGATDLEPQPNARTWALPWVMGDVWVEDEGDTRCDPPPPLPRPGKDGQPWRRAADGEKGEIVITLPYPYLARTIWGDAEGFRVEGGRVAPGWKGDARRWEDGYWRRWRGAWAYTQGDFAIRHADGSFSLHGRSDDVINVSGHRMGTEEIEGAILRDKALDPASPVGNVLVVGAPHREKGLTPLAFIIPAAGRRITHDDRKRLAELVRTEKGAVAVPSDFLEVPQFPETRSGKYVRRMVRALVEGGELGDASTLRNPEALDELRQVIADWQRRQRLSEEQELVERWRYVSVQYNTLPGPGDRLVATATIANPPVNALNERALDELVVVAEHLARKERVAAVVWTGEGGAFVAGADIRQLLEDVHSLEEARVLPANAQLAFSRIERMGKPSVAAINGVALGGGMEFALACHLRVAEPTARFGQPEIRLRLLPGYGGTQRLVRLLTDARGREGLLDSLDLILGGRSIDAGTARAMGLLDALAEGAADALSLAHAMVRDWARDPQGSTLGRAFAARMEAVERWARPADLPLDMVLEDGHIHTILAQLDWAGRGPAGERALVAIRTGLEQGTAAGYAAEAEAFAQAIIDPEGGKAGIRSFLDKQAAPLPVRRDGRFDTPPEEHARRKQELIAEGGLLPLGAPFFPGVTPIPPHQLAWGVARDAATGAPRHGPPATHERELIVPVDEPGPNDALVYMLTSEVNFNDIWALTGIPVSPFDNHDNDFQTTGSGGIGLVAALGPEARAEGRLKVGDLVAIYSGTSDLLSPMAGRDPMFADFAIQGYETETGSHAQFLKVQAPQAHSLPPDLTLEQAGSYILNLGTVSRCLFTTLQVKAGARIFVEGAATGTGLDALRTSIRSGLHATGLVSSAERAAFVAAQGAVGAIDRKDPRWAAAFAPVPEDPGQWPAWEAAGRPILEAYRQLNDGQLADFAVSHAGEQAFPRSFQLLADGGVLAFYGASSGYHFTFMGKPGTASPEEMLARAGLTGGEAVLIYYGPASRELLDPVGLEMIEAARRARSRIGVVTTTDGQRGFLSSLGLEEAIEGVVSLEDLKRRLGEAFDWPPTLPRLPDAKADIEAFKTAVRDFQERTMKPFGQAIGRILRSPADPRGAPDIIVERAGHDALGVSTALVRPFTGRVVYAEEMAGRRFAFYAPQVWTRQRRILMPTAEIRGTHLCNAYEVTRMNAMIAAGLIEVTEPTVIGWDELPAAHQSMWDNAHKGATYVVNHALPELGLRSKEALFEHWAARMTRPTRETGHG
jgi:acrylyl-CoA reductase (NADPH)/3-hydroxypropionyl-CoA dehydratase/3-hydroxypropionyl-CoA synthetase